MPNEQPCLSNQSPCATSSKNAKDKHNSTTLLAMCDTKDADSSSEKGSGCSSEKDSGYSDGSDWQQTDVEDQRSNKSQSTASEHAETSQRHNQEQRNPGNHTVMPVGQDHPHICIIEDTVHKQQPSKIRKRGQLLWRNGTRENSCSGSPNVLLLQQPSLLPPTLQPHKPSPRKPNVTGKKKNDTCRPILKSYPRIAPHPTKKPPDKSSSNYESLNLSKRVCTENKSDDTPVDRGLLEQHVHKQLKLAVSTSGLPSSSANRDSLSASSPTPASTSQRCPSMSSPHSTSSFLTTRGPHRNASTSIYDRRFFNTLQILRQSGLLDITLHTKELLRQSNATERDIAQLRQHTELLCQAADSPSLYLNDMTAWEHLHQAMAESGSYPNLRVLQNLQIQSHPNSARQAGSTSTDDTDRPQTSPLTIVPDQSCGIPPQTGDKSSDKVTFIPPDSSTG